MAQGYAESLFGLAEVEDQVDRLEDELFEFGKLLQDNFQVKEFLLDEKRPAEAKHKFLSEIIKPEASTLLKNELNILVEQNRAALISKVIEVFLELVKTKKNRLLAEVVTAVPLTPELQQKIGQRLSKMTEKNVSVKNTVDQSIVGGMVIKAEGKVVNLSIERRLESLKRGMGKT